MESLNLPKTQYTLGVDLNSETGVLAMTGASYPENALEFFQPIFSWLESYTSDIKNVVHFNFKVDYLNTSSTKCIMEILEILEEYGGKGGDVDINWFFEKDDEDILEIGEDLTDDIEIPINFVPY